jgi:hypothetical protein
VVIGPVRPNAQVSFAFRRRSPISPVCAPVALASELWQGKGSITLVCWRSKWAVRSVHGLLRALYQWWYKAVRRTVYGRTSSDSSAWL